MYVTTAPVSQAQIVKRFPRTTGCRRREIEQLYEGMFLGHQCVMTKFVKLYKTWGLTL